MYLMPLSPYSLKILLLEFQSEIKRENVAFEGGIAYINETVAAAE
jgi:hypothetical protein